MKVISAGAVKEPKRWVMAPHRNSATRADGVTVSNTFRSPKPFAVWRDVSPIQHRAWLNRTDSRRRAFASIEAAMKAADEAWPMGKVRACRFCGCTDARACITTKGPCRWVEADICSAPECVDARADELVQIARAKKSARRARA